MVRPLTLLVAIAAVAPLPALAQTFPAGAMVVASVHSLGPQSRAFASLETGTPTFRPPEATKPTQPNAEQPVMRLKARSALDADEVPQVDIRAKSEWSDDQGFRASPTKVSYKVRF